ncbi:hypothetical protein PTNB85_08650 [Pyrenophora teres f. teres]|nr:hypothetical protein PTNB85_08650 [Pyrenophora teres f. teres]
MVGPSRMLYNSYKFLVLGLMASVFFDASAAHTIKKTRDASAGRQRTSLNANWRFERFTSNPDGLSYDILKPWIMPVANEFLSGKKYDRPSGDAPGANVSYVQSSFDDAAWEAVTLPHDWAISGTFNAPGVSGDLGFLPINGVGWYRRMVSMNAEIISSGKSVYLDVDGAMAYAAVWLNGQLVGGWPYGYNSFRLDLTPYAKAGDNTLAIRLDNKLESSRWYPGAGIYRNIWLVTVSPVHVGHYGTYITTPSVSTTEATVNIVLDIENKGNSSQSVEVVTEIYERDATTKKATGACVATFPTAKADVAGLTKHSVNGSVVVTNPKLWGPLPEQTPNEYIAISTVSVNGMSVDTYETNFGIRSIRLDKDHGVFINGKYTYVKGTCNHHTLGSLGAAWNTRAAERQIEALQEMGNNALRTSHNPPAAEFLDLADSMGLMVMDEMYDTWSFGKVDNDFHLIFPEWHEPDLRSFIRRDRNHPSIISWSIGNELPDQKNSSGTATGKALQDIAHEEDPTRLVTLGMNNASPDTGLAAEIDIIGLNYQGEGKGTSWRSTFPRFHEKFPEKMIWSTESSSCVSSRGVYIFPVTANKSAIVGGHTGEGGDMVNSQVSSYDLYAPEWASSPDKVFEMQDRHPYVAGEFVWTGWDYIGEPTPYSNTSKSSFFGIIDLAGFKKDRFYLYQARWRSDLPMAHILPHWTWPEDRVGEITPVHVYTSGDEVELFVNGVTAGRQTRGKYDYRLRWDGIQYKHGNVTAVAYKNGTEWARDTKLTAGAAKSLNVTADRTTIAADGYDLSFVSVEVLDANGTLVPMANHAITFEVTSGPGMIISTDNGDPTDLVPFPELTRKAFNGMALAIVQGKADNTGEIIIEAKAEGLKSGKVVVKTTKEDIHYTAQWSAPSPGGLTRLCADANDKKVRDWFREQVLALGAEYKVNATGTQFALVRGEDSSIPPIAMGSHLDSVATGGKFDGPLGVLGGLEVLRSMREQGIKTRAPLVLINWTNEEGARFFPPLGSSSVYAGKTSVAQAHASTSNDHSGLTMGGELAKIGYVGSGPNLFAEFHISAHFEIHVEQSTDLEKAGKPVGWVEGWQGMTWYSLQLTGEDGHANTYKMDRRRDALVGAAKIITAVDETAYKYNGGSTVTNILSGPWGSCNIQSSTCLSFCLMNRDATLLDTMGADLEMRIREIAAKQKLELTMKRDIHLYPGKFWPEAVDCVKRACGNKGIASRTGTGHDSTMTTLLVPTAMVFVRAKGGVSHCAQEWSSKEDCGEGALALGRAVLNFDEVLRGKMVEA